MCVVFQTKELKHSPFQAPLGLRRQDYDVAAAAADRSVEAEGSEEEESDVEDSNGGSLEGEDSEQMEDDNSVQDFAMGQH